MARNFEILYREDCPSYREAEEALQQALVEEGIEAEVTLVLGRV
jgi:hypothetical protein